ncbi:DUF5953 family protein [Corallococcus exercitus]
MTLAIRAAARTIGFPDPRRLDALKRAYHCFPEIGGRVTP